MQDEQWPGIFEPDAESISADALAVLQRDRLRSMIDRLMAVGGMQAARLREAGVSAGQDVTLADLPRLPMTAKTDLWDNYPFGLLAVPRGDVVTVHGSSGTGGRPTLVAYTRGDLRLWARMCARALAGAGATADSIVHNAYGYGLFTGGIGIHQGAVELGAMVVPVSGGMTPRQVMLIADLRPDILTCTPSYAVRLGEALAEAGLGPAAGPAAGPGAGPSGSAGRVRAQPARGTVRRRAVDGLDAGPHRGATGDPRAGHLRAVRGHRPGGGGGVPGGRRRAARQRGPLHRRGGRSGERRPGARRHARGTGVHHRDQGGAAAAALSHRRHRGAAPG